jgi:glycylpeptide N-tetradecanoyltransferase
MTDEEIKAKVLQMHIEKYQRKQAKHKEQKEKKDHKFWNTQPMPGNEKAIADVDVDDHGPIDPNTDIMKVRQEPLNMPAGFEWCSIDIMDPTQAQEVYKLLNENYVEDDECMFRFDYSVPFLQWALTPPNYRQDWHVGVRATNSGKLMGCITAIPAHIRIYDVVQDMVEINFLCVHKKLRTKRLAPVLIKEITRRVNVTGRWQAVYTAGVYLPKPIGLSRYYHRSLQPKKLIDIRFSSLPPKETLANHLKRLKLPDRPVHPLRPMTAADVPRVHELIQEHLKRYRIYIHSYYYDCEK